MNHRWPWPYWLVAGQVLVIILLIVYSVWRDTLPGVIWTLHSGSVLDRATAAYKLGKMGPAAREAIPALNQALDDPDRSVQGAAATALRQIGGFPALAQAMQSPNPAARTAVVTQFLNLPRTPATDEQRLRLLIAALKDPSPQVRQQAARDLAQMGSAAEPALPALSSAVYDPDAFVRAAAIEAIATVGSLEDLAKALSSPDAAVRLLVLQHLQKFGQAAIPVLNGALQDADQYNAVRAADMLGYMDPPATSAVPALARALQRPELYVRQRVLADLERIGTPEAAAAIQEASNDPDMRVRSAAQAALLRLQRRTPR